MNKKSILIGIFSLAWFFCALLQAQPLARYTFDDGTPGDNSGNGMDGVLLGDAVIAADPERGQVLQINQSGMQADGPFDITTSFTLSAWVKLDVPRTGRYYFGGPWWIRTDNQGGSEHHWCEIRYPEGAFVDKFDTRSGNSPEGQLDGQWHHIVVVLPEDGSIKAYVDGALAPVRDNNTKAHDYEGTVGPLFFGTQDENGGNAISGYMDDIQVYNYAVSEDEIPAIMEGGGLDYPFALSPNPADGVLHMKHG
ncbi:MAG: LamG domain-containing protein [Planctomycetes bacterium]|nr:LamG domain-containing protein [Planctomycetota bacterium]